MNDVTSYVAVAEKRLVMAFGRTVSAPDPGFVPYNGKDQMLIQHINRFFSSLNEWSTLDLDGFRQEFRGQYWSVFHYLGWDGLFSLTPAMLHLVYQGYKESDELCVSVVSVFSDFPRNSDDRTASFLDWTEMYNTSQIMCILDALILLAKDPLKLFPGLSIEGIRWWARQLMVKIEQER